MHMSFSGGRDRGHLVETLRGALDRRSEEQLLELGLEKAWRIPTDDEEDQEMEFLLGLTPSGEFVFFGRDQGDTEWGGKQALSAKSFEEAMKEAEGLIKQQF